MNEKLTTERVDLILTQLYGGLNYLEERLRLMDLLNEDKNTSYEVVCDTIKAQFQIEDNSGMKELVISIFNMENQEILKFKKVNDVNYEMLINDQKILNNFNKLNVAQSINLKQVANKINGLYKEKEEKDSKEEDILIKEFKQKINKDENQESNKNKLFTKFMNFGINLFSLKDRVEASLGEKRMNAIITDTFRIINLIEEVELFDKKINIKALKFEYDEINVKLSKTDLSKNNSYLYKYDFTKNNEKICSIQVINNEIKFMINNTVIKKRENQEVLMKEINLSNLNRLGAEMVLNKHSNNNKPEGELVNNALNKITESENNDTKLSSAWVKQEILFTILKQREKRLNNLTNELRETVVNAKNFLE